MNEGLTVNKLAEMLADLIEKGYGCKPVGIETLGDITCCLSEDDVHYDENYDSVMISTTNI